MSGDHGELWDYILDTRRELAEAQDHIKELQAKVASLEGQTPQAQQLQHEADVAMADAAEWDYHGRDCTCPYCPPGDSEVRP